MNRGSLSKILSLALTGLLTLGTGSLIFAQRPASIPQGGKRPDGARPDNAPVFPGRGGRGNRP